MNKLTISILFTLFHHLIFAGSNKIKLFKTIADIRLISSPSIFANYYTTDNGKEGLWYYDASDFSSADNLGTILVSKNGKRFKRILKDGFIHVRWFGTKADSINDDAPALQLAINSGKSIYFDKGIYLIKHTLFIPAHRKLYGNNTKIFNNTNRNLIFFSLLGDVDIFRIGFEGVSNSSTNLSNIFINITGIDNSPDAPKYRKNIKISNCKFKNAGYFIFTNFVKNITVTNCVGNNFGYAGFMFLSSENISVLNNKIDCGYPMGDQQNAYGISFSQLTPKGATETAYPRSKNFKAIGNTIINNLIWEAIDTHGGMNGIISDNFIDNCNVGIVATRVSINDVETKAPKHISISRNTINCSGLIGLFGIAIVGASQSVGTITEYADNCLVIHNKIIGAGMDEVTGTTGAIYVRSSKGTIISFNTIINAKNNGISVDYNNIGLSIYKNVIIDPNSAVNTEPSGIRIRNGYNKLLIEGNSFLRQNKLLNKFVSVFGLRVAKDTTISITFKKNIDKTLNIYKGL